MSDINYGRLPLLAAAEEGNLEMVRQCIAEGADLEAVDTSEQGRAALGIAASKGYLDVVRLLLASGADPNGPVQSEHGPLQDAVLSADAEMVQVLFEHGAKVNATDARERHALSSAVFQSDIDPEKSLGTIVRLLIAMGSDIEHTDSWEKTPLYIASEHEPPNAAALEVMRILLEAGADCNVRVGDDAWTPLTAATEERNVEAVRLLVEAGADVNLIYDHGDTAWNQARRWGYSEIAALLEKAGAIEPAEAATDLHRAILWGNTAAVAQLLERGADANAQDRQGRSALLSAIYYWGKEEIVRLLLDYGAAVDVGMPLMTAVHNGSSSPARSTFHCAAVD